jgi:ribosomal protein L28
MEWQARVMQAARLFAESTPELSVVGHGEEAHATPLRVSKRPGRTRTPWPCSTRPSNNLSTLLDRRIYPAEMASSLLRRSCSLAPTRRAFSTSTPRLASLQWDRNNSEALADTVPDYPYGPPTLYKQSRQGLYGEQRIRFGNNVSVKGKNKSRRSWRPNIMFKRIFSKALNRHVQVRVSSRVLRTIDKLGGLDEYLLGEKETRIRELGESGWWLRWAIMQTNTVKNRFAAERRALGLPADPEELRVEEEDAEAVLAASTPDAEIAQLTLGESGDAEIQPESMVSEVLAEDDVFEIEQNKDLPPLKFRVGRNKYIMLTPQGWRSLTPSPQALKAEEQAAKDKIRSTLREQRSDLYAEKLQALEKQLMAKEVSYTVEQVPATTEPSTSYGSAAPAEPKVTYEERTRPLTAEELADIQAELEPLIRREANREIEAIVQKKYEAPILRMQALKEQRRLAKIQRKAEDKIVEEPIAV